MWLAQFLYFVIRRNRALHGDARGRREAAQGLSRARRRNLKTIVNEQCWDGAWFVRAFRTTARRWASKGQKEGFIWINSQTWAVIAGISDEDRLNTCMDAVEKHLGTAVRH